MADFAEIKIAICDDKQDQRINILNLLSKYLDINSLTAKIDQYESGEELLNVDISTYNLIVLDIFMGELNGIQTAEAIREKNNTVQIIFCSTSREFAADSYDVAALHYLIKPINEQKLFGALNVFFTAYNKCKTVTYKSNRLDETIFASDILYLESGKNHKTIIHTANEEIITRTTVNEILAQVQTENFVSPIRYAIVNMAAVAALPTDVLILTDGTQIPIAREKRAEIKKLYTSYKMRTLLQKGGNDI